MNTTKSKVYYFDPPFTLEVFEGEDFTFEKTANTLEEIWELIEDIEPIHLTLYHNKTFDEIFGNQDSWGDFLYYRFGHSIVFPIQDGNAKVIYTISQPLK